jgi:hypothetical protein
MKLRGARELRARLQASAKVGHQVGQRWATDAASEARDSAPRRTGHLAQSFRPGQATGSRVGLMAVWYARLVDAGARPHTITPRRSPSLVFDGKGGNTIFAKRVRHPGMRGTRFIARAARDAFRRTPMARTLADVWNRAA